MTLMPAWSPQQVLALAPDASSAKASRELAALRKWINPGYNDQVLWGEQQGSAARPYQTIVELTTPVFYCSCPSRKFPCKHALGLFLLFAQQPDALTVGVAPAWVAEWLAARIRRAITAQSPAVESPAATKAQTRRSTAREAKVAAGLTDLERWLHDLIRQGLAQAQTQPYHFWANQASRLVDAQAPGVANLILAMATIPGHGIGWQNHLLERLAQLHLLLAAYHRLPDLPAVIQADIRTFIGWVHSQEELLAQPGLRDQWLVLGQRVVEENNLRVQRTWLVGAQTERSALVLHFAAPGQPLESSLTTGLRLDAELVFYPSAWPMRGLIKQRFATEAITTFAGHRSIAEALAAYSEALTHVPWLERFPLAVQGVTPIHEDGQWWVADAAGAALPLAQHFGQGWTLLAVSGGGPVALFGEWNGATFWPLSVFQGRRLINL
jgi:hypothetical protein